MSLVGDALDDGGKPQEAIADYDKAIALDPAYASAYYNRGITRKNTGDKKRACEDFNKAVELGSELAVKYADACK